MEGASQMIGAFINGGIQVCDSEIDDAINWEELGPFNSDGAVSGQSVVCSNFNHQTQAQGRIEAITVNPNDNTDIVIGGVNGGIWRSQDGGANWVNTTDDEGYTFNSLLW